MELLFTSINPNKLANTKLIKGIRLIRQCELSISLFDFCTRMNY
ncbi:hypothetical protein PHOSAC3_120894 [Mesotoga infera]|nr:hypothetical protein PHOSAC3_120894 [Mesotoga infera]